MYEDDTTNRMLESLQLFDKIINGSWLAEKRIILFLNKKDVLETKLKTKPLKTTFTEYTGNDTMEEAINYITEQFLQCNKGKKERLIVRVCQATDSANVNSSFDEVKKILASSY